MVAHASSTLTDFIRRRISSGTLGRPSGKRSPFHAGVKKINSSLEICWPCVLRLMVSTMANTKNSLTGFIYTCGLLFDGIRLDVHSLERLPRSGTRTTCLPDRHD